MSQAFAGIEDAPEAQLQPSPNALTLHPHRDVDDEDQITAVVCYHRTAVRTFITVIGGILTIAFLWLFALWYVKFRAWLMFKKCSPEEATHYLVTSSYSTAIVRRDQKTTGQRGMLSTFTYRFLHYYVQGNEVFPLIFETSRTYSSFHSDLGSGYSDENPIRELRTLYGSGKLDIPEQSTCLLLITETLTPSVLFQCYTVGLWSYEIYVWYAVTAFLLTLTSVVTILVEIRRNIRRVRFLAGESFKVTVIRGRKEQEIDSDALVHGDLIVVPNAGKVPCDLVLISGSAVMKESMLTGKSAPVIKEPIPDRQDSTYDIEKDKLYTLYHGTESLQATPEQGQQYVLAVAARTGFHTLKGRLIRSILFPKPNLFQFAKESKLFILVLTLIVAIGFLIMLKPMLDLSLGSEYVTLRCLDLIAIGIPPALPAAMAIGTAFATSRLRNSGILCISPTCINVAGEVRLMVFDKTGTLTQDGMKLIGVIPAEDKEQHLEYGSFAALAASPLFLTNLITCQALREIEGSLVGDNTDIAIFQSTRWKLRGGRPASVLTSPEGDRKVRLVRVFHFDSALKRMAVIVEERGERRFHVKGAPEVISALCNQSTVPEKMSQVLEQYTQIGLRILACASGPVPIEYTSEALETMNISDLERNLQFLGLVVLENKLKDESAGAIEQLKKARIPCVVATGDASLTGLAVARDCGIIDKNDEVFIGDYTDGNASWRRLSFSPEKQVNEEAKGNSHSRATASSRVQPSIRILRRVA